MGPAARGDDKVADAVFSSTVKDLRAEIEQGKYPRMDSPSGMHMAFQPPRPRSWRDVRPIIRRPAIHPSDKLDQEPLPED